MVTKNKNKFLSLAIYSSLVIILCYFVFATVTVYTQSEHDSFNVTEDVYMLYNLSFNASTVKDQNISSISITLPSSFTLNNSYTNASFDNNYSVASNVITYINSTGNYINASNSTAGIYIWFNASAATAGNFNITITWINGSDGANAGIANSTTLDVYVNDSTYPTGIASDTALEATNLRAGGNYSGTKTLNFTVTEDLHSHLFFNVTNVSGLQNLTLNATRQGTSSYYNATLVTNTLLDGNYSVRVHVNDTAGVGGTSYALGANTADVSLSNTSYWVNFTIDNSAPSVSIAQSSSTSTTLTLTITITEPISGVQGTCSSSRADATITGGRTTTQTLTESSLSCNTNYSYTITCGDGAGNQGSATAGFKTSACGSSGSSSSSSSGGATTWTNTHNYASEELSEKGPLTKEFGAKQRVKLRINNTFHYAGVKELTASTAKIEISSTPQEATLNIGDTRKFDVDGSGATGETYDLMVTLNSITNNKADLTINSIDEVITADTQAAQQQANSNAAATAGDEGGASGDDEGEPSSLLWLWIVIAVVIIGGGIALLLLNKKR